MYARIDLKNTNYLVMSTGWRILVDIDTAQLQNLYSSYCRYKKFSSVMPIFDSEFFNVDNDVIGYFDRTSLVAFSIVRRFDKDNAECVQFAWDYANPKLGLGIASLKNECAIYRNLGFKYLYLGSADEYKKKIQGFEMLGPIV